MTILSPDELLSTENRVRLIDASAHLDRLGLEYYVNFYGLFEPPFQVTGTDLRFVYLSEQSKKVISICLQVVRDRMDLGAVGPGKSSIIRSRLSARSDYRVACEE